MGMDSFWSQIEESTVKEEDFESAKRGLQIMYIVAYESSVSISDMQELFDAVSVSELEHLFEEFHEFDLEENSDNEHEVKNAYQTLMEINRMCGLTQRVVALSSVKRRGLL